MQPRPPPPMMMMMPGMQQHGMPQMSPPGGMTMPTGMGNSGMGMHPGMFQSGPGSMGGGSMPPGSMGGGMMGMNGMGGMPGLPNNGMPPPPMFNPAQGGLPNLPPEFRMQGQAPPPPGPPPPDPRPPAPAGPPPSEGGGRRGPGPRGETQDQIDHKARMAEVEKKKCHLHKKPKNGCKFCKKHQELLEEATQKNRKSQPSSSGEAKLSGAGGGMAEDRDLEREGPLELANNKNYGFGGLLQTHIVECAHYKSLLTLETIDQLVDEAYQYANSVEPYMPNSATVPSALFCCLYRFFTMGLDARGLRRLVDNQMSPFIRCIGLLYVRFGLPHDQLLAWCGEYLLDDEPFKPAPDSDYTTTIGEFVETLLSQDRYYSTVFPRLPMSTKRRVEEELAPLGQNRKRMKANKALIETFNERGLRVECSMKGEWRPATVMELEDDPPSRPKVRVRLEDGTEEYVHLGKVILADKNAAKSARTGGTGGARGRSRSRSRNDWSREKGRSDKELVDELRSKDRERALAQGKDYAKKPVGYKAACALPREQGQASYRLMEEETFVPMNRQKSTRSPSPQRDTFRAAPSAEHQARMQQLFEKYGNQARTDGAARQTDVEQPDVMRLG